MKDKKPVRAYLRLLRDNPDFAKLWLAQVVSLTGDWFNTVVLSAKVVEYNPENSGIAIALLLIARFVPPALLSPFAGVLVDRFDRQKLLMWSNLLRAGVVLLYLPTLNNPDLLWLIYALSIIQFVLSAVFEPGQNALLPSLIRREDLVIGNTLVSMTWSVMLAIGAVAGGVVATVFGSAVALIVDALTFVVAAWILSRITGYEYVSAAERTRRGEPLIDTKFSEGLRWLRKNPEVIPTILVKGGGSIGNIDTLMTIYATQIFVIGTGGQFSLGLMYSVFGIGAILGPVLLNRFHNGSVPELRRLILVGFVGVTLGWVVLGAAGSLIVVLLAIVVRAMGGSANWVYSSVIVQKTVPDTHMGRVFALDMAGFHLMTVLSTIVHGTIVDAVGSESAGLVAYGTVVAAMVPLVGWWLVLRWLRGRPVKIETVTESPIVAGD